MKKAGIPSNPENLSNLQQNTMRKNMVGLLELKKKP